MEMNTIVYRDHRMVGRGTVGGWQFTIVGTGRHTGTHRELAAAVKEAQEIVDTALDWKQHHT